MFQINELSWEQVQRWEQRTGTPDTLPILQTEIQCAAVGGSFDGCLFLDYFKNQMLLSHAQKKRMCLGDDTVFKTFV